MYLASSGASIGITALVLVLTVLLGVAFYFLIKLNVKKFHEENDNISDKTLSKSDIMHSIDAYIKKIGKFGDFSLIYFDIDNFTSMNDVFGREQCDEFLQQIATRLQKRFPYRTLISKYQNDEFLVFIKENLTYEQVCKVADAILGDVRAKMYVSTSESISLSASAGICLYPSCGKTADELLRNIELATYVSKREGGNKYTVFYKNMTKEEADNYKFFIEIKKAIANKEFCLYYQPIINLNTNNICAYEALMRWNHPVQGVLPPAKFMNIMEQSGDIYWVGKWGLEIIASKYESLASLVSGEFKLSLNLSTRQLTYETTADDLMLVARKASVDPKNIVLEISGYTMFEKLDNVKRNLLKLRDGGFTIAVDGFELDYSTITKIQKEPIDMIKINRSFLLDIDKSGPEEKKIKEKFVKMLVDSADIAHRTVVCEGVETAEQEAYIKSQGINVGQGYYYSKPIPEEEIEDFIRYRKWESHSDAGLTTEAKPEENKAELTEEEIAEAAKAAEAEVKAAEDAKISEAPTSENNTVAEEKASTEPVEEETPAEEVETADEAPAVEANEEESTEEEAPAEETKPVEEETPTEETSEPEESEKEEKVDPKEMLRRRRELLKQKRAQEAADEDDEDEE